MRELRVALGLDSGYVSRLLRALEREGLVRVEPDPADRRVRIAQLTRKGLAERRLIDRESDRVAESMLAPLAPAERAELVAAMRSVDRLLTSASIEIAVADPASADARFCFDAYFAELHRRAPAGFDASAAIPVAPGDLAPPAGTLLIASLAGKPVACGGVKHASGTPAEIKRMWVSEEVRGRGLGRRLLAELEQRARAHGATVARLETNGALVEAIALYCSEGYAEIEAFNDEPFADHWFEKRL